MEKRILGNVFNDNSGSSGEKSSNVEDSSQYLLDKKPLFEEKRELLPIERQRESIIQAIGDNDVVIISAETASGKSTRVPFYAYESMRRNGIKGQVVVTQPRVIAAEKIVSFVSRENDPESDVGQMVGLHTGVKKKITSSTQIIYATDGLEQVMHLWNVRKLEGDNRQVEDYILIIDELHEWNENIEALVANIHRLYKQGVRFKVVLMSAEDESKELKAFFKDIENLKIEHLHIEGRPYEVEVVEEYSRPMKSVIVEQALKGRHVLVFQPNENAIVNCIQSLNQELVKHSTDKKFVIIPLYSQDPNHDDNRDLIFSSLKSNEVRIIVATDIAQTSLTIDYIDDVVDSGLIMRPYVDYGIEGLQEEYVSLADVRQRRGRASRTKAGGKYFYCGEKAYNQLSSKSPVSVQRNLLDVFYLRCLVGGIDLQQCPTFHKIDPDIIHSAHRLVCDLGLIDESGEVTELGKTVASLPVGVRTGTMLVGALKAGLEWDLALTLGALQDKYLWNKEPPPRERLFEVKNNDSCRVRILKEIGLTVQSDPLIQMLLFELRREKPNDFNLIGFNKKIWNTVVNIRGKLEHNPAIRKLISVPDNQKQELSVDGLLYQLVVTQLDRLYILDESCGSRSRRYFPAGGTQEGLKYSISYNSALFGDGNLPSLVVGRLFGFNNREPWLTQVTGVDHELLKKVDPVGFREITKILYNPYSGQVIKEIGTNYKQHEISRKIELIKDNETIALAIARNALSSILDWRMLFAKTAISEISTFVGKARRLYPMENIREAQEYWLKEELKEVLESLPVGTNLSKKFLLNHQCSIAFDPQMILTFLGEEKTYKNWGDDLDNRYPDKLVANGIRISLEYPDHTTVRIRVPQNKAKSLAKFTNGDLSPLKELMDRKIILDILTEDNFPKVLISGEVESLEKTSLVNKAKELFLEQAWRDFEAPRSKAIQELEWGKDLPPLNDFPLEKTEVCSWGKEKIFAYPYLQYSGFIHFQYRPYLTYRVTFIRDEKRAQAANTYNYSILKDHWQQEQQLHQANLGDSKQPVFAVHYPDHEGVSRFSYEKPQSNLLQKPNGYYGNKKRDDYTIWEIVKSATNNKRDFSVKPGHYQDNRPHLDHVSCYRWDGAKGEEVAFFLKTMVQIDQVDLRSQVEEERLRHLANSSKEKDIFSFVTARVLSGWGLDDVSLSDLESVLETWKMVLEYPPIAQYDRSAQTRFSWKDMPDIEFRMMKSVRDLVIEKIKDLIEEKFRWYRNLKDNLETVEGVIDRVCKHNIYLKELYTEDNVPGLLIRHLLEVQRHSPAVTTYDLTRYLEHNAEFLAELLFELV